MDPRPITYSACALKQLRTAPASMMRPRGLPKMSILLLQPQVPPSPPPDKLQFPCDYITPVMVKRRVHKSHSDSITQHQVVRKQPLRRSNSTIGTQNSQGIDNNIPKKPPLRRSNTVMFSPRGQGSGGDQAGVKKAPLRKSRSAVFGPTLEKVSSPKIKRNKNRRRTCSEHNSPARTDPKTALRTLSSPIVIQRHPKDTRTLHKSDKAWTRKVEEDNTEDPGTLATQLLALLNKMTSRNMDRLVEQVTCLDMRTKEDMQVLVTAVHDKAAMEHTFADTYAHLCWKLRHMRPRPLKSKVSEDKSGRLQKDSMGYLIKEKCVASLKGSTLEEVDRLDKGSKNQETNYQNKLKKIRYQGNIRFIGSLYNHGLLGECFLHECLDRLLQHASDPALMLATQLMLVSGPLMEERGANSDIDRHFAKIYKCMDNIKPRTKFALMDLMELRHNHWTRRINQTPLKPTSEALSTVHEEAPAKVTKATKVTRDSVVVPTPCID